MTTNTVIYDHVRERLGVPTSDPALTDAILLDLINAANRKLSLVHDWPWLVTTDTTLTATVADQAEYTPASNWRKTLYLVCDSDQELQLRQAQDIVRYQANSGYPFFYAVKGTTIQISPTPDTVYTLEHEYIKSVTLMTLGSEESEVPEWALDLLIEGVCVLAAKRLHDTDLARAMQQEYSETLEVMRDEVRRTKQNPVPRHRTDIGWT